MKASAINPQFDARRCAGNLSRTQRSALVAARDAEDNSVDRGYQNVGEGDVQVTSATLRALVEKGLGAPVGTSPLAFTINALGIEVAELIKPYVPRPTRAEQLVALVTDVIREHAAVEASPNDVRDIIELHGSGAGVAHLADFVFDGWRITSVRSDQNKAIDAAVAVRDALNETDLTD